MCTHIPMRSGVEYVVLMPPPRSICLPCPAALLLHAPSPPGPPAPYRRRPAPVQVAGGGIHQANLDTLRTVLSAVDSSTSTDAAARTQTVNRIHDDLVNVRCKDDLSTSWSISICSLRSSVHPHL